MSESKPGQQVLSIKFENHKVPEFKEVKKDNRVNFGDDNLYPEYLIELALRSAKHGAILAGKVNYIYGGGLQVVSKGASITAKALANKFIKQLNDDNFIRKMIQDFEWFNGFYIEPILTKGGKLDSINYIPFAKIRVSPDEKKLEYSNDWRIGTRQDKEKTGYKIFDAFDFENPKNGALFYYKIVSPKNGRDRNVYPVPEYIGACASIETDIEIANYHLNNIKTGFAVGTMINLNNGVPDEAAQAVIEGKIKKKFQGTDKAGSVLLTFNQSADQAPTITSFAPSDLDKQFIEISKRVEQDIFTGHKITNPALFGVNATGVVFQRDDLVDSFELFQNTYTDLRQKALEDVINKFASMNGVSAKIEFKRVQAVKKSIPEDAIKRVYDAYSVEQLAEELGMAAPKKAVAVAMLKDKDVESVFAKYGRISGGTILHETPMSFTEDFDFSKFEAGLMMSFKKRQVLTPNQKAIIDLLEKDSLTPSETIAKVLKIGPSEVNEMISELETEGYLDSDKVPTLKGEGAIEDGAKTDHIAVEYKYTWRPDVKNRDKSHSREFCQLRMDEAAAGKTYTSNELLSMSNELDTNVWEFRGGWWNKGDGVNVPYCRHIWSAVVKKY